MTINSFLTRLFGKKRSGDFFYLWIADRVVKKIGKPDRKSGTSYWFTDLKKAADFAQEKSEKIDVYFGIALADKARGSLRRVSEDSAVALPALWCEVDYHTECKAAHKKENIPETAEQALELIHKMPAPPSLVVASGHGFHAYWLFTELLRLDSAEARLRIKTVNEKWKRLLEHNASLKGWDVDSTFDLARVYRLPQTINHKCDKKHTARVIETDDKARYTPEQLAALIDAQPVQVEAKHTKQQTQLKENQAKVGALELDPKADVSHAAFEMLCEVEPKFKLAWEHKRRTKDQSVSSYDMTLANYAVQAGWSDQQIANLLIAHRRKYGEDLKLRQDYYAGTIAKARTQDRQETALARVESGEAPTREQALEDLSTLLTVCVTGVQRFHTDPRSYVMRLGNGSYVEFKNQGELTEQGKLAGALFDYANVIMPTFKNAEWTNVKRCIIACIEDVQSSQESTHLGSCIGWLRAYLRRHLRPEMEREGQIRSAIEGRPAVFDNQIWFSMDNFRRSIMLDSSEQPPSKSILSVRLKQIGCEYNERRDLHVEGIHTTRALWTAAPSFNEDAFIFSPETKTSEALDEVGATPEDVEAELERLAIAEEADTREQAQKPALDFDGLANDLQDDDFNGQF